MPDAATAGGSSSRVCVGRVCPGLMQSVLLVDIVLEYTFRVWSVFRQVERAIGGVMRGACFA